MSPRRTMLTVQDWPQPKSGKAYRCRIDKCRLRRKAAVLQIDLYHLDSEMEGKLQSLDFALPIRPGNPLSRFLGACQLDVSQIGSHVCLDEIIGRLVGLRYEKASGSEERAAVTFIPVPDPSASKPASTGNP